VALSLPWVLAEHQLAERQLAEHRLAEHRLAEHRLVLPLAQSQAQKLEVE
jgi:hypothetical protein